MRRRLLRFLIVGLLSLIPYCATASLFEVSMPVADKSSRKLSQDPHLPFREGERPKVMVWAIKDTKRERHFVSDEGDPEAKAYLETMATRYGLNLLFPLMDLEDITSVKEDDVWSLMPESVQSSANRYGVDYVILGRFTDNVTEWEGHWMLLGKAKSITWSSRGGSWHDVLGKAVDDLSQRLVPAYTSPLVNESQGFSSVLELTVSGVGTPSQYTQIQDYLKHLSQVESASIKNIEGDTITFEVKPKSGLQALSTAIQKDGLLRQDSSDAGLLKYQMAF